MTKAGWPAPPPHVWILLQIMIKPHPLAQGREEKAASSQGSFQSDSTPRGSGKCYQHLHGHFRSSHAQMALMGGPNGLYCFLHVSEKAREVWFVFEQRHFHREGIMAPSPRFCWGQWTGPRVSGWLVLSCPAHLPSCSLALLSLMAA